MKKIIICLMAVLAFAACNNKTENQENSNALEQTEREAPAADEQDGWMKQTTFMSAKPMVIDFYATWCGPCQQLVPIMDEIEKNHKGEVIFERIDVDEHPELAQEFNIEAIPMLMFITPKGEYKTIVGLEDASVIEAKIAELLTRSAK